MKQECSRACGQLHCHHCLPSVQLLLRKPSQNFWLGLFILSSVSFSLLVVFVTPYDICPPPQLRATWFQDLCGYVHAWSRPPFFRKDINLQIWNCENDSIRVYYVSDGNLYCADLCEAKWASMAMVIINYTAYNVTKLISCFYEILAYCFCVKPSAEVTIKVVTVKGTKIAAWNQLIHSKNSKDEITFQCFSACHTAAIAFQINIKKFNISSCI